MNVQYIVVVAKKNWCNMLLYSMPFVHKEELSKDWISIFPVDFLKLLVLYLIGSVEWIKKTKARRSSILSVISFVLFIQ